MTDTATLKAILTEHAIPSRDWKAIKELTFNGTRPSNALLQRLRNVGKLCGRATFYLD